MSDKVQTFNQNYSRTLNFMRATCFVAICFVGAIAAAEPAQVRVRLKSGGFIAGKLVNSSADGKVAIQCDTFASPLEVDVAAIRSIDEMQRDKPIGAAEQTFLLAGGNSIAGNYYDSTLKSSRCSRPHWVN